MFKNSGVKTFGKILAILGCVALCLGFFAVHFFAIGFGLILSAIPFICIGNIETAVVEILEIQKQILDYQKKTYLATVKKTTVI